MLSPHHQWHFGQLIMMMLNPSPHTILEKLKVLLLAHGISPLYLHSFLVVCKECSCRVSIILWDYKILILPYYIWGVLLAQGIIIPTNICWQLWSAIISLVAVWGTFLVYSSFYFVTLCCVCKLLSLIVLLLSKSKQCLYTLLNQNLPGKSCADKIREEIELSKQGGAAVRIYLARLHPKPLLNAYIFLKIQGVPQPTDTIPAYLGKDKKEVLLLPCK